MSQKGRVYVIGAGISGLVAAWRLLELGYNVDVWEKDLKVGGMAGSFAWGHFKYLDFGPHIYHSPDEEIKKIWQEKFGDLLVEGECWAQSIKGKDVTHSGYDYPLSIETINTLPADLRMRALYELEHLDEDKKNRATNFSEYVEGLVGPTLQQLFFNKYTEKLWGIGVENLTANWAPKRIRITEKSQSIHAGQWCASSKFGSGAVMDRLADEIIKLGGRLHLNTIVTSIKAEDNLITEIILNNSEKKIINPEDVIISTAPISIMADYLGLSNKLTFRGIKLVFVAANKSIVLKDKFNSFYFDDDDLIFHRLSEQKKACAIGFPEDKTVITAEIAYSQGDAVDNCHPDRLISRTVEDLIKLKLIEPEDFLYGKVVSLPHLYPLLTKDTEEELSRVNSYLQGFKQLYLAGNGGEFHYGDLQILYAKSIDLANRLDNRQLESVELTKQKTFTNFNKKVKLGKYEVGGSNHFIIAEIGQNHNGSLEIAKNLIDEAAKAGCNAVKMQTYRTTSRLTEINKTNKYAEKTLEIEESIFENLKRNELTVDNHRELFAYATAKNLEIFSTPFDLESLNLLESLGCKFYKISSMDVVNLPLIKAVADTGKPIIMSTGMSSLGQIEDAINVIRSSGNKNLVLLHCLSAYPASPKDMNLRVVKTLKKIFNVPVGLSDHSVGLTVATVGLAIGANIIERHFTLDRFMEGPDHILSSDPGEMTELVKLANLVPIIKGSGEKLIIESEIEAINRFKKCLYAKVDIEVGEIITADKLMINGPGGGILPKYIDILIGRTAKLKIAKDEMISWNSF